ncbi:MAG: phosphatase PAP2 family protein [Terrimonas ferruginea]|jgi:membrane-associated phospholipid phosphatase|uniref:phosphatase PAP2 family protein n=1 Tax=Terrimonas ferruginea TaxID=249 RepID=UPI00086C95C8|nr:phosphatase PAP2 family protein [Terrimonas ferruginea]MBN8783399.1 phosphatase PAP2 family protein [Terrimonas ferruginea]ODS71902.1 MAG: phospholipid phosphatase [Cytophagaceae bacterium SCN 52-12]OJW40174.1 MAG: phospholipid phosphatase [Sphingobacteriales bacterium 48-107]
MRSLFTTLLLLSFSVFSFAQQDSIRINQPLHFSIRQLQLPAGLIAAGILSNGKSAESVKNEVLESRNKNIQGFHTKIDNYLQYAPIALAYGLDAFGVPSRNDLLNRSVILAKGELIMLGSVNFLKKTTHTLRPDGTTYNSFPSGHTAQAFAAATFLSEEYKGRLPWMPYAAYGIASSVGVLRMANNRHYVSDVLVGAGIGILSMKLAYWTHQYKWGRNKQRLLPVF